MSHRINVFIITLIMALLAACGGGGGGSGDEGGGGGSVAGGVGSGSSGSGSGGTPSAQPEPVKLSAGWHHTCALMDNGTVQCWGSNGHGELGDGTTTDSPTPVLVVSDNTGTLLTGVEEVSASRYYTCARLDTGGVKCWGWNEGGKLGDGKVDYNSFNLSAAVAPFIPYADEASSSYPVDVVDTNDQPLTDAVSVTAGSWHACALRENHQVVCWGQNFDGALGIGKDPVDFDPLNPDWDTLFSPRALTVVTAAGSQSPLTDVIQISAGSSDHTCALIDPDQDGKGRVRCWAWNGGSEGQLGNGNLTDAYAVAPSDPVQLNDGNNTVIENATQIAAGADHTCALLDTNEVVCWGWNAYGQVGSNSSAGSAPRAEYVLVDNQGTRLTDVKRIVTERGSHTCALKNDNSLWCWGDNTHGQLGQDPTLVDKAPFAIPGPTNLPGTILEVAVGGGGRDPLDNALIQYDGMHTCALVETNQGKDVWCWGSNDHGQLGDGTTTDSHEPVQVTGL